MMKKTYNILWVMAVLMSGWLCGCQHVAVQAAAAENVISLTGGVSGTGEATLTVYPAGEEANGWGMIICPGGGYGHLAMEKEGSEVAAWLNRIGVTAFVLKYRLPGEGFVHPAPLADAQQAIRLVRARVKQWGLDEGKIGIMGFSAGGHLAASAGTHFARPVEAGEVSCRPDFMVLIYPVISMRDELTHQGSKRNLLGVGANEALAAMMSNEEQVTEQTPPVFLVHASDDRVVAAENSVRFYQACLRAGVKAELHVFIEGGHGFGLRGGGVAKQWPELCEAWMGKLIDREVN